MDILIFGKILKKQEKKEKPEDPAPSKEEPDGDQLDTVQETEAEWALEQRNIDLNQESAQLKEKIANLEQDFEVSRREYFELKDQLRFLENKKIDSTDSVLKEKSVKHQDKMEEYYHKMLLFDLLLDRYKDYIDQKEEKTVQDLKEEVQPHNPLVINLAKQFENNPKKAYDYLVDEIHSVPSIGVNFWMTIEEMIENRIADYEDKAILTCSVFKAMGLESSVMIVELSNGNNLPLVLIKGSESSILCDPNHKHDFDKYVGNVDALVEAFDLDGSKVAQVLYEFDDKEYEGY